MPDREKAVKTLESILDADIYEDWLSEEDRQNVCDAINLLKGQEAEWVYGEDETGVDGWYCSECTFFEPWFYAFDADIDFIKRYEYCPKCGRRMTLYTGKQEGR